ncbi:putative transcription factor interactor and regulator CCHC(Zn) family [Helianthus annuus]|uniref:Transcription factor interactor and regulator CCHC(Zn) family n=1 Tax=Helianthus annuus TaxID=4232 RepID=A0A9K3IRV8_HELAN|nr:putative transcription factor interactor and regulator CCHC(Zn) family [Helianthus annuus]
MPAQSAQNAQQNQSDPNPNVIQCNIAVNLNNAQNFNAETSKQQMVFLASILESYESLITGKIGNTNLTKEDYDQIDPEEMELIDIRWCIARVIRRAQRFMEITGRQSIGGPSTKLGFDKPKLTCFKCKQKCHFKRECKNSAVDEIANLFQDDYYRKAVYHRNREEPPKMRQIEDNLVKEKSRALAVIQDDEGFNWNDFIPDDDQIGSAFVVDVKQVTFNREREIAHVRMNRIHRAYKEVVKAKRWDTERECYLDPKGNVCTDPKTIEFDALVKSIPTVEEERLKREAEEKAEKERKENSEKVVNEIIDVNVEMTAENLKKMADQVFMAKALEVDTKSASESESSSKVSSVGPSVESGKAQDIKTESDCRNFMKACKVYNTNEFVLKSNIQYLTGRINNLKNDMVLKDRIVKSSKERIDELTEKIKNDEKDV